MLNPVFSLWPLQPVLSHLTIATIVVVIILFQYGNTTYNKVDNFITSLASWKINVFFSWTKVLNFDKWIRSKSYKTVDDKGDDLHMFRRGVRSRWVQQWRRIRQPVGPKRYPQSLHPEPGTENVLSTPQVAWRFSIMYFYLNFSK